MCGVPPPEKLAPCSENMCDVPLSRYTLFLSGVPPPIQFCALNTLALSLILSKIVNLASSSIQDEAKLNLYPRVWHSQLSLFPDILDLIGHSRPPRAYLVLSEHIGSFVKFSASQGILRNFRISGILGIQLQSWTLRTILAIKIFQASEDTIFLAS